MNSGNKLYGWIRILFPIFLEWLLSMLVTTAAIWYCRNILVLGVQDQLDSFQTEAYWREQYRQMSLAITAATHALSFAVMAFFYRRDLRTDGAAFESEGRPHVVWYLVLPVLGVSSCFVANGLLNLSGLMRLFADEYESISSVLYNSSSLWLSAATVVIAAPLAEEVLFRGLCYRRMRMQMPAVQAIFMSAFLFGAYHGNVVQAIYGFALGVVLAWSYERFRSLAAPVLLHMCANAFSFLLSKIRELNAFLGGSMLRMVLSVLLFTLAGSFCFYLVQVRMHNKEKRS